MRIRTVLPVLACILFLSFGVNPATAQQGGGPGGLTISSTFIVSSPAFEDGGVVPQTHAGRGDNISPELNWVGAPDGTASFAVIFHDADVAVGDTDDVLHWIVWDIPGSATGLPQGGVPDGSVQGAGITGQNAYFGPAAPASDKYHHYVFEVYALNAMLDLPATASRAEVLAAMSGGKVVGKAIYVGRYHQ